MTIIGGGGVAIRNRIHRGSKMRSIKVVALALSVPLTAFAAGSGPFGISANVTGQCKVSTPPGTLNFGTIDPSSSSNVTATATFSMKCTKGTIATAPTDNGGLHNLAGTNRMVHSANGAAFLPYSVTYSGAVGFTGQGFGAAAVAQTVTVSGQITPAQFQDALSTTGAQSYNDTVTITVNP